MMDRNVPIGTSFLGEGTITILFPFLNFAWLPFCEIKANPLLRNTLMISFDEGSLDIDRSFTY